jgi:hypothetical protein
MSGPAISAWLNMSGVGVSTAEVTKAPSTAYLRFFASIFGVTTPMRDSRVMASGSSKTAPKATVNLSRKST